MAPIWDPSKTDTITYRHLPPPGDDTELCTDVLQDTLFALHSLPPALLFDNTKRSSVWGDIVTKTTK